MYGIGSSLIWKKEKEVRDRGTEGIGRDRRGEGEVMKYVRNAEVIKLNQLTS